MFEVVETRLENSENIAEVLKYKIDEYNQKGLPVEQSLADYIALGISGFDEKISKLKEYKKQIDETIKELQRQKQEASLQIAEWFEANDIDKLKGVAVSSVTVKPESVSITKKLVLDVDKEELVTQGFAHYEEQYKESLKGIKINKKRKKDDNK